MTCQEHAPSPAPAGKGQEKQQLTFRQISAAGLAIRRAPSMVTSSAPGFAHHAPFTKGWVVCEHRLFSVSRTITDGVSNYCSNCSNVIKMGSAEGNSVRGHWALTVKSVKTGARVRAKQGCLPPDCYPRPADFRAPRSRHPTPATVVPQTGKPDAAPGGDGSATAAALPAALAQDKPVTPGSVGHGGFPSKPLPAEGQQRG